MKPRIFILSIVLAFVVACHSGNDSANRKDSANTLQDTLPANGPGDSLPPDSNPPDATKINSGNRTPN